MVGLFILTEAVKLSCFKTGILLSFCVCHTDYLRAVTSSAWLRPSLAKSLLGWEPRRLPLTEDMKTYYASWLASQDQAE